MTLFKRIALGLIALVVIIAVVGVFAVSHLDLTRQKARIEARVFEETGRELQINGALNPSLFPWFGLSLSEVSMGNAREFPDTEFATISSAEIEVAFLPLLTGRIEIEKVSLQGVSLKLLRDADGKTNWDDLMATTAVVETESGDNVVREIEAGAPIIAALSVGDVQIIDSDISYSDARDESYLAFSDLNLSTGTVLLSEPFAFESDFNVISSAASGLSSVVSAKGEIAIDLVNNIYVLQQLKLSTVNSGTALPLDPLPLSLNGELVADFNAQSVDIMIADGLLTGFPVSGEFHATSWQDNLQLNGHLKSGEFDATPFIERFEMLNLNQFPVELLKNARVSARFVHNEDLLQIQDFEAAASDVVVNGDFQIVNPSGSGVFSGWIQTNTFDPAPWARGFGWTKEDSSVMRLAQLSSDVRQSGQLLSFNQIDFQLDDSNITGSVEVSDINAEQLPITYALSVDSINLDNYLSANFSSLADGENWQAGVNALRQLSLEGEVTVDEITLAGINAQRAVIPLIADEGKLNIAEATAELYAGSFFSSVTLDVQAEQPVLSVTGNMNGLQVETLLQDVLNKESPLTGIANVSVDLISRGQDWSRLLEYANGALSLRVTDGSLKGIDITSRLRSPDLPNDASRTNSESSQAFVPVTQFGEYSISAELTDGLLKSDDLLFSSPGLRITGEGGVNIGTESMDYLLHLVVTSDPQAEQDDTLQNLSGMELGIPLNGVYTEFSTEGSAGLSGFISNEFQTSLSREIRSLYRSESGLTSDEKAEIKAQVKEQIKLDKAALRQRLATEQQNAAAVTREQKQQPELSTEEALRQLELQREKDALKDELENNLKDNLNGLLGDN